MGDYGAWQRKKQEESESKRMWLFIAIILIGYIGGSILFSGCSIIHRDQINFLNTLQDRMNPKTPEPPELTLFDLKWLIIDRKNELLGKY